MPAAQHYTRIISADSHVMEPLHLWWHALGHKFGDRTPRSLSEYQGQQGNFFYTGYTYCISDVIYCLLISCWHNGRQIGQRVAQK